MTSNGKFSVLIAVYYKEKPEYLNRALKSITDDQLLKPNEIVIIKDGPLTEELDLIIQLYIKQYPNLFKVKLLEKNVGLGEALRIGVLECSNEIIARMDSDDVSLPERFKTQLRIMNDNDYDVIGTNVAYFEYDETTIYSMKVLPEDHEKIYNMSKRRSPVAHATVMFRKNSVIEAGNYNNKFPIYEDYLLWVSLLWKGKKFYNVQECLYKVRAPKEFYGRRRGLTYLITELKVNYYFFKIGHISILTFAYNSILRIIIRLLPKSVVKIFYLSFLRTSIKNIE